MRPLRLVIAGLNSFKEAQEIDFGRLCEGNVFGIFGPTGSGKSTVVDAITLALYGTVKRANRRTQGIVNKALMEASVLFEWQLGSGAEQKTYRVERKYVAKDESVNCRLARLSELQGEETIVLADKASQVDQAVQDILGLTEDDFTRAVVLPQGRFAEFLNLQGGERRRMLERIFGLEEYGEQLNKLVGERLKVTETALQGIVGKQEMLGAATAEDVALAKQQMDEGEAELSVRKQAAGQAQLESERWSRVRERQQELQQVELGLAELARRAGDIATLQQQVERQAAAERVAGPLQAADAAAQREGVAGAALQQVAAEVISLDAAEAQALAFAEATQAVRQQQEGPLQKKLEQLDRAIRLEQRVNPLSLELAGKLNYGQGLSTQVEEQATALAAAKATAAGLGQVLENLRLELGQNRVDPVGRERLAAAIAAQDKYQAVVDQLQEVDIEVGTRHEQLASAAEQLQQITIELISEQAELSRQQAEFTELMSQAPANVASEQLQLASAYQAEAQQLVYDRRGLELQQQAAITLGETMSLLKQQLTSSDQQIAAAEKAIGSATVEVFRIECALAVARERNMAALLAQNLQPGQPCPVCGSLEHQPTVQADPSGEVEELERALVLARSRAQTQETQRATAEASRVNQQGELTKQQTAGERAKLELQAAEARVAEQLAKLPAAWIVDGDWTAMPQRALAYSAELGEQLRRRAEWQAKLEQSQESRQAGAERVGHSQQQVNLLQQTIAGQQAEVGRLAEKRASLGEQEALWQVELGRCLAELGEADLMAARRRYQRMDRRFGELDELFRQKQDQRGSLEQLISQAEQQVGDLREWQVQARTEYRLEKAKLDELQAELTVLTGGVAATMLKRTTEENLAELLKRATAAQVCLEQARRQAAAAKQDHSAKLEAFRLASVAESDTRATFAIALAREQFVTRGEAESALAWATSVREWQQDIKTYQNQQESLQRRAGELSTLLAGQSIEEAVWLGLVHLAETATTAHELAIAALAKARELLSQVQGRHAQWVELEAERVKLVGQKELLTELVSLLRGNALVEFMASEHLDAIAGIATDWLGLLTGRRYALEIAPDGGFLIRDDGNGGERRPVYTLSGGETFITSLALALALSSQVQLRGKHRLEFFFLDEGFGSLDPGLLEVVMGCLERMQGQQMSIGVISHVPELKERILHQVLVTPAELGGRGSRVQVAVG